MPKRASSSLSLSEQRAKRSSARVRFLGNWRNVLRGLFIVTGLATVASAQDLERLQYNHRGLTVDLGVGLWAWPLPMDWDADGDMDLLVSCPDKPFNGTYFFENKEGHVKLPVFEPGVRIGPGRKNLTVAHVDGRYRILDSNQELTGINAGSFERLQVESIYGRARIHESSGNQRFNVWRYVDYDMDGTRDVLVGADDWGFYGWDDGYDSQGNWKKGPLHGAVYVLLNLGTNQAPQYADPRRLLADEKPINVYGNPMPNLADFDGDGDADLICGEFLDGLTYFENVGSASEPRFAERGYLRSGSNKIALHVQMITPSAVDWDGDGDPDLVVGDEDGRVALIENLGLGGGTQPQFSRPQYFQQKARDVKFGALVTPVSFDWDGDGDEDLVCGNTSGNIAWFENLGASDIPGSNTPKWSPPQLMQVDGKHIHIQAGPNGSIQGPAEAKWGYTTLSVADWNGDNLPDIIVNSIWGRIEWFENIGTRQQPRLSPARPVRVSWSDGAPKPEWVWWKPGPTELVTQWRTTPIAHDWNKDGLMDLIVLDTDGYLAYFERTRHDGQLWLSEGRRIFAVDAFDNRQRRREPSERSDGRLRLNMGKNGSSGRRKLCLTDWDGDGLTDILVNSANVSWLRNAGQKDGLVHFEDRGTLATQVLAGHTTSPTTVDWDGDGQRELLIGAEDGRFYFQSNK